MIALIHRPMDLNENNFFHQTTSSLKNLSYRLESFHGPVFFSFAFHHKYLIGLRSGLFVRYFIKLICFSWRKALTLFARRYIIIIRKIKIISFSNYHDQKFRRTPTQDLREHWTPVSTLLRLISSVYRNLHLWRSNQRPQIAVPKIYNYRTQVTPNQLVMVIAQPNNLNVSCKLHLYSFQRTRSSPRATSCREA